MSEPKPRAPFDPEVLNQLAEDVGVESLPEILEAFLMEIPRLVREMESAVAAGDPALAWRQAHSIKGSAAFMGMGPLRSTARAMDRAGKQGRLDLLRRLMPRMAERAEAACEAVRTHLV
jgi:HPt (histidine-containing phosphotransfer) domain-containing protein